MAGVSIMNTLRENVTDYLATRRAMGFKVEGLSKLLLSFVVFLRGTRCYPRAERPRGAMGHGQDQGSRQ